MPHRIAIAAFALIGAMLVGAPCAAEQEPDVESEAPAETGAPATFDPPIVTEPPVPMLPKRTVPTPKFDSSELDKARVDVLWNRNWFLASGSAQAFGWILLGAAFSRCETINGVDVCPTAADKAGTAGAAIVVLSGVPLIVTSIMYGVRSRQKKELERLTLRSVTDYGRHPPPPAFDQWRLDDSQARIRSARNGLIASTAMLGFGWIFLGAAIPRCQPTTDGLVNCTNPGYAHLVIGLTFASSGAIGMLVSGIVLGARKKNERVLRQSIDRRKNARFRWDPERGSFVF
jgi:hypothetical protein